MSKNNPLFVDSTRMQSDQISTEIELTQVLPYDGERVFFQMTDRQGHRHNHELQSVEDGVMATRIWFQHQQELRYRFVIKKEDQVVAQSPLRKTNAAYIIEEPWEPELEEISVKKGQPPAYLQPGGYRIREEDENQGDETMEDFKHPLDEDPLKFSDIVKKWGF